jgi:hypothetical protein
MKKTKKKKKKRWLAGNQEELDSMGRGPQIMERVDADGFQL